MGGRIRFVEARVRGFDRQLSTLRHRILGIHREVEKRAFQLIGVSFHLPKTGARHSLELDCFPKRSVQQVGHTGHQAIDIDRLGCQRLAPRKSQ